LKNIDKDFLTEGGKRELNKLIKNKKEEQVKDKKDKLKTKEGKESPQKKYEEAKQIISSFEDEYDKASYKSEAEFSQDLKDFEDEWKDDIKDGEKGDKWYEMAKENLDKLKKYRNSIKNLSRYKDKAMDEAGQAKMFKAKQLLMEGLEKAKKAPIGTVNTKTGRKKVAEGKWVPVSEEKEKKSTSEVPEKDKKKKPEKEKVTEDNKERLKNALKKNGKYSCRCNIR
jgi:hypothetical protein